VRIDIPVPGGEEVVFPTGPSPFIAVGQNRGPEDIREAWDVRDGKITGRIRGAAGLTDPLILSPDGAFLAGRGGAGRMGVDVWAFRTGTCVQRLADVELLDFGSPGQLLTMKRAPRGKWLQVWDLTRGKKMHQIAGPLWFHDWSTIAVSAGRRYLALTSYDHLLVYDLNNGATAGLLPLPEADSSSNLFCQGLAFAPDGQELAGLFIDHGTSRILVWDVRQGALAANHRFSVDLKSQVQNTFFYRGRPLDWLPARSGWLAYGQALVDRTTGKLMGHVPVDSDDLWMGPRKILEPHHLLLVSGELHQRTVASMPLPWPRPQPKRGPGVPE
jgi:hypothetical protein